MKRALALLAVTTLCASQPSRAAENSPAPTPTQTPAPVVAATNGQTRTLADIARERKLGKKGVQGGTLSVSGAPVSGVPVSAAPVSQASGAPLAKPAAVADEETVWRQRNADARGELAAAQAALAQADASLPAAVAYGRGARASAAIQNQVREGTLLPYRARVEEAQARVNALPEEARKAGAQPGWVR
jgi:hypothetical protein